MEIYLSSMNDNMTGKVYFELLGQTGNLSMIDEHVAEFQKDSSHYGLHKLYDVRVNYVSLFVVCGPLVCVSLLLIPY